MANVSQACIDIAVVCWAEAHPGTAAWVQALLTPVSVALAALAIVTPALLHRRQENERRIENLRAAATAAGAGAGVVGLVYQAAEIARDQPTNFKMPPGLLQSGAQAVRDFPLHTLWERSAAAAMHTVRVLVESALEDAADIERLAPAGKVTPEFVDMLRDRALKAHEAWEILAKLSGAQWDEGDRMP